MKTKAAKFLGGLAVLAVLVPALPARADTTQVLPKGRSSVSLSFMQDSINREFDSQGRDRELGYYFDDVNVTDIANGSGLFPFTFDLVMLTEKSSVDLRAWIFAYQYGITDHLSVGVGFPYFVEARTNVIFQTLGYPNGGVPAPVLDLTPLVQGVLKSMGYKTVKNFSGGPGIGDVQLGLKYRIPVNDAVSFALGGYGTLPSGRINDTANLTDITYGNGHYDLGVYGMTDLNAGKIATLNLTGRYDYSFPFQRKVFVIDPSNPLATYELATKKVTGNYDQGDWYEGEAELRFHLAKGMDIFTGYSYRQQWGDRIDGKAMPLTENISRIAWYGLSADTTGLYLDKAAKLPVIFSIYQEPMQTGKKMVKTNPTFVSVQLFF